jgi:hypothetical protein
MVWDFSGSLGISEKTCIAQKLSHNSPVPYYTSSNKDERCREEAKISSQGLQNRPSSAAQPAWPQGYLTAGPLSVALVVVAQMAELIGREMVDLTAEGVVAAQADQVDLGAGVG